MTTQCCVCKKVKTGDRWVAVAHPERIASHATHGYCPVCAMVEFAKIEEFVVARKGNQARTLDA